MARLGPIPGAFFELMTAITVNATAVVYSNSIDTRDARYLGARIKATSAGGTPDIKVEWECSNKKPATETSADTDYVVPDNMTTPWTSIADEVWHVTQLFPPPASYGRLKITGNTSNPTDTLVTGQVFIQG